MVITNNYATFAVEMKKEIETIRDSLVEALSPVRIYLFGSHAEGRSTEASDVDLYILMDDEESDIVTNTATAHRTIRKLKQHPVDIIVGRLQNFNNRKTQHTVEHEVDRKGVVIYER